MSCTATGLECCSACHQDDAPCCACGQYEPRYRERPIPCSNPRCRHTVTDARATHCPTCQNRLDHLTTNNSQGAPTQ